MYILNENLYFQATWLKLRKEDLTALHRCATILLTKLAKTPQTTKKTTLHRLIILQTFSKNPWKKASLQTIFKKQRTLSMNHGMHL